MAESETKQWLELYVAVQDMPRPLCHSEPGGDAYLAVGLKYMGLLWRVSEKGTKPKRTAVITNKFDHNNLDKLVENANKALREHVGVVPIKILRRTPRRPAIYRLEGYCPLTRLQYDRIAARVLYHRKPQQKDYKPAADFRLA